MELEQVSAELFGRSCRLPVALWVLRQEPPRFYQSQPPAILGAPTAVRQELERLTRAGLLTVEKEEGNHRVYYSRTSSPLWRIFSEAAEVITTHGG